jgi:hypothetical protein
MKSIHNSGLAKLSIALLVLGLLFRITQSALPPFQALPINGIDDNHQQQNRVLEGELKNLYPLVAIHSEKDGQQKIGEIISVDEAFMPKANKPEPTHNKTPDLFPLLKSNKVLKLQAMANNGAFLNGRFYPYGAEITEFSYPALSGKTVTPLLQQASTNGSVTIAENPGKRHFALSLDDK